MTEPEKAPQPQGTGKSPSPPVLSLPKGGGAIRGIGEKFAANPVTGTGSLSVPVYSSPGRAGFGPQFALTYDSGSGNGPFGVGWTFSLPSITRKTDKGLPQYRDDDESDVFILAGSEDLVPVLVQESGKWVRNPITRTAGADDYDVQFYRPRIEGLFARVERWTNSKTGVIHWRSITKDNVTTIYGENANSTISDPVDTDPQHPRRIFTWLISQTYDDRGNAIVYEYKSENSDGVDLSQASEQNRTGPVRSTNRYLKRVRYGNRVSKLIEPDLAPDQWMFEVVLDYGEHDAQAPMPNDPGEWFCRNDSFSTYRAGFEVRTYRLCQRVLMFHHFPDEEGVGQNCLVRSTDIVYQNTRGNPDDLKRGNPIASFIATATQSGYRRTASGYLKTSMPPVEFEYSQAEIQPEIHDIDFESLENLPGGLDGAIYQWVDLDGEGLSGILSEQANGWFYKRNLSPISVAVAGTQKVVARFAPLELASTQPSPASLGKGGQQFLDLAGDGQLDLVQFGGPLAGFSERNKEGGWSAFTAFSSRPEINWDDPGLKFVDLTGDGHADIIVSEDNVFTWYASLAEEGFGAGERICLALDEEEGPSLVFADGTQSIYLADMSGDGLTDLARIRCGEICYWPNLGYGRFGAKVTMNNAPLLDHPEVFDQRRVRLADIDGSGVTDLLYLASDGVHIYFNESGNRWSDARNLDQFPPIDSIASVTTIDLLGNGTACLVWSCSLPGASRQAMRYIDLMGGQKPHLLVGMKNNMGAETIMRYAPSTRFYLEDKYAGNPWITKLSFPVHVVERIETVDRISRNRFVTRYAYHHGYFDGPEREFRGFGMIEQWDTEEFATLSSIDVVPDSSNIDAASHVPPALTRTWFHTGGWLDGAQVTKQFAHEYYNEGDASLGESELTQEQLSAMLLDDTVLPDSVKLQDGARIPWNLSVDEVCEAVRALKGSVLRQEVYALDGSEESDRPYNVSERNYTIELLQPRGENRHAVFLAHPREALDFHYERKLHDVNNGRLCDPRVSHSMVLSVDGFGNVLEAASIAYGRRHEDPDPLLTDEDRQNQSRILITCIENQYTYAVDEDDAYRAPLNCEARTYQLYNLEPDAQQPYVTNLFRFDEMTGKVQSAGDGLHDIPYENTYASGITPGIAHRRLIKQTRKLYRRDDLIGALLFREMQSLGLELETYRLALTPGLLSSVYQRHIDNQPPEDLLPDPASVFNDEGGYVDLDGDGRWWIPSGRVFYHPNTNSTPAQELDRARELFFQPVRFQDPFLNTTLVTYDQSSTGQEYNLIVSSTLDAAGNLTTVKNDYRVLQPYQVTDANGNRTESAFDTLGMVVGTAVMGKESETLGDSLTGFQPDLGESTIIAHLENPLDDPHVVLGSATTRLIYDIHRYLRTSGTGNPQPNVIYTLARETHDSELTPGQLTNIQHSISYSDGFGREIQKKVQAEPGPVALGGAVVSPRWTGSGWTIFNNKSKAVRKYEPFFSTTHQFEFAKAIGVSPVLLYDPSDRLVATLHPNHTYEKVVFDPWRQETWDMNDTVLQLDPKGDLDVGSFFARLPDEDYLPTWHAQRVAGAMGVQEQAAADKSAVHALTPTVAHFDSLGHPFLTVIENRFERTGATIEENYTTRVRMDVEGNHREVVDSKDRLVISMDYDMTSRQIHLSGMDAGERWTASDISGKPMFTWDSQARRAHSIYDTMRRPISTFVLTGNGPELQVENLVYGESQGDQFNHRTRIFQHSDGAGVVTNDAYDFKGNLLSLSRQLAVDYQNVLDWSAPVVLEEQVYTQVSSYDAMNRPVTSTTPDNSLIRPSYNEAGLLERIDVNLQGAADATTFISDLRYNAKMQHELIEYGNGVRTTFEYEPLTSRLASLQTLRGVEALQSLSYTYDPAGNITEIRDSAQQTIYFNNQVVEPNADYTYDAIYRLIEAAGREHIGQAAQPQTSWDDEFRTNLSHPNDGQAMRRYTEHYEYDEVGNLLSLVHQAVNGDWTRAYTYTKPSQVEPGKSSNRLSSAAVGNLSESFDYDAHGNLLAMQHLPALAWDYQNRLQKVTLSDGGHAYYLYDAGGQRVRKVIERPNGTRKQQRIYFGSFEVYSEYNGGGETVTLERETLQVMYGSTSIALVETLTAGNDNSPPRLVRYQVTNHLGSASLELDSNGLIISYEEYYPYGCTSYEAVRGGLEANPKRYRYNGKERDEETGFYYYGARYYCCYLGRWISPDPAGLVDGTNLYAYVKNNPVILRDADGREAEKVPIYWVVAIPAAARAAKDTGIPIQNAMLLLIWARGEQAPTKLSADKKSVLPYSPDSHSGRLLNSQPTPDEIKNICPDYKKESCKVDKADGEYKGAYIYNLFQLLTPSTKEKEGEKGDSAHFGFGDTYSMFVHTIRRIGGKKLEKEVKKENGGSEFGETSASPPKFGAINRKLRDPNTTPEQFFTPDMDIWAKPGYSATIVADKHPQAVPIEVRKWIPKIIESNKDIIARAEADKGPLKAEIARLTAQNAAIEKQDVILQADRGLQWANYNLIKENMSKLADLQGIIDAKTKENLALVEFQAAVDPTRKK